MLTFREELQGDRELSLLKCDETQWPCLLCHELL